LYGWKTFFDDFYCPGMDWFNNDKRILVQALVSFTDVGFIGKIGPKLDEKSRS